MKSLTNISTPEKLYQWMSQNIKYSKYKNLKSAEEVFTSKSGSCHDQVIFELNELRSMGLRCSAIFLIEYNPETNQGGETHSLVYYNKNNKIYWFENAWHDNRGIHEFSSVKELKDTLKEYHKTFRLGNVRRYSELEITSFGNHKTGESLQEFVDICLK